MKISVKQLRSTIEEALSEMKLGVAGSAPGRAHPMDADENGPIMGEPDPVEVSQVRMMLKQITTEPFIDNDDAAEHNKQNLEDPDFSGWVSKKPKN